jgi:hypothetical protein
MPTIFTRTSIVPSLRTSTYCVDLAVAALLVAAAVLSLPTGCTATPPSLQDLPRDPGLQPLPNLPLPPPKPACRAAASGELLWNEVLSRPAGIDLDGDAKSNLRDEALELVVLADEPVHAFGAELSVAGSVRGKVASTGCLAPQSFAVLLGASTGPVQLPSGAAELRLDHALKLPDTGADLKLTGTHGEALALATYPPETVHDEAASWTREIDGERGSTFMRHTDHPATFGQPHSLGACASAQPACECLAPQGMDCPRLPRDVTQAAADG